MGGCGALLFLLFFALISSVVSCCFVAAKESANVSIQNSKKYDIALIKKQHRRRGGRLMYILFNMLNLHGYIIYCLCVFRNICH